MVMIDGKEYQKKEMLLKNTKYNSALIEYEYLLDKLEALKLKIIDKQIINKYCKMCRKYSADDIYCQEISSIDYDNETLCFEPKGKFMGNQE